MRRRIVLATFGTLGDIYPFIAAALELERRGFDPLIVAPVTHRAAVDGEGLAFAPMRPSDDEIPAASGVDAVGAFALMLRNPHFILDDIYLRFLAENFDDVVAASGGASAILYHSLLIGAGQAAEMLRLPCARLTLAPLHLQSAMAPSATPGAPYHLRPRGPASLAWNRIVRRAVRGVTERRMGRLHAFRAARGMPLGREDVFLDFGRPNRAERVFALYAPAFAPPQRDQPANLAVVGFPFYAPRDPGRSSLDPALAAFLDAGEAPIVCTLGSFAPRVAGGFYETYLRATRRLGHRCVLLAGLAEAGRLASRTAPGMFICAGAPHALLFPCARAVIHHGGIGTAAEAIRAGRPQLVVPFFGDQPDHAARVERLGLGRTLRLARFDEDRAVASLTNLLAGVYAERALAFRARIAGDPGVTAIADWCEALGDREAA